MEEDDRRYEYVLNEYGRIYAGRSIWRFDFRPWVFGQVCTSLAQLHS